MLDLGLIYRLQDLIQNATQENGFATASHLTRVVAKAMVKAGKANGSKRLLRVGEIFAGVSIINSSIAFFSSFNEEFDPFTIAYAFLEFAVSTVKNMKTVFIAQKELKKLQRRDSGTVGGDENGEGQAMTTE